MSNWHNALIFSLWPHVAHTKAAFPNSPHEVNGNIFFIIINFSNNSNLPFSIINCGDIRTLGPQIDIFWYVIYFHSCFVHISWNSANKQIAFWWGQETMMRSCACNFFSWLESSFLLIHVFHNVWWAHKKNLIPVTFIEAHSKSASGVRMWPSVVACNDFLDANLLIVPPIPSQTLLPWEVAKKCHSAVSWKSNLWCMRLEKFLKFLYWLAAPSEKYFTFFTWGSRSLRYLKCIQIKYLLFC